MPTLEERVQALEDKEEILHLMNAYAHAMDEGRDIDAWNDLYTEDAVWQGTPVTSTGGTGLTRIEGRKAMAEWWLRAGRAEAAYWGPGHRASHHCVVMIDIRIDGNRASAVSYGLITAEHPNGPILRVTGKYTDVIVKCDDGRWRFKKRHLERDCTTADMQVRPMETPSRAEMQKWRDRAAAEMAEVLAKREPWRDEFKAELTKAKSAVSG
jgi:ketosteroid isomerase-like protein